MAYVLHAPWLRGNVTTLKIREDTHELPRMSDVSALLEIKIRLQNTYERIEQSHVIIHRAGERVEQSADRLLWSQAIAQKQGLARQGRIQTDTLASG